MKKRTSRANEADRPCPFNSSLLCVVLNASLRTTLPKIFHVQQPRRSRTQENVSTLASRKVEFGVYQKYTTGSVPQKSSGLIWQKNPQKIDHSFRTQGFSAFDERKCRLQPCCMRPQRSSAMF
jgi:hypothetical protein